MRVAHLLPTLEIGGRERAALDLARAQRALGVDAFVVTHGEPVAGRATLDPGAVPVLRPGALETVDLIHAHGHMSAIPAARTGISCLATIHVALGSGWRWAPPVIAALRRMDRVTAVSTDLARRFSWLTGRHIEVLQNGCDLGRVMPARLLANDQLRVAMVARLHPVKRHQDALSALPLLRVRGLHARLLIAGDGPLDQALRADARDRGDVELLGPVDDVPALLASCDAFLLCSDHEGTPLALLEAMAAGLPCVATSVGGVRALVGARDGVTLVPRRNPLAIAEALSQLSDIDVRRRRGAVARARAVQFGLDGVAARYHDIYVEILRRPAAGRRRTEETQSVAIGGCAP